MSRDQQNTRLLTSSLPLTRLLYPPLGFAFFRMWTGSVQI